MDLLNFEHILILKKKQWIVKEIVLLLLYQGKNEKLIKQKLSFFFFGLKRPEKNVFRLRKDVRKNVTVALQQIRGFPLNIER